MMFRGLAILGLLLALAQGAAPASGQASKSSSAKPQAQAPTQIPPPAAAAASGAATPAGPSAPTGKPDSNLGPSDDQQPRFIVSVPPPVVAPWTLREKIAWAANLVLAVLGYVGIMLALSTLRKIERHTKSAELAAGAAADSAQAALLNAQALAEAERPWLLVAIEPTPGVENGFDIKVANRGRSPAKILSSLERMIFAVDDAHLPATPEYRQEGQAGAPQVPIILVPGESTTILKFCRDDLKLLCQTPERLKRVENWEERLFLYGKVVYRDLITPADQQLHETAWCCWYIHGRQKSGLVLDGPPEYNSHT
jgi:hypothetical protein